MLFDSIDIPIPFSRRHANETIRNIIRYDSGYLKDLFLNDERVVFSQRCLVELQRLTKGQIDNWEKPDDKCTNIFNSLKSYATPYLFDFNNDEIELINQNRLNNIK